MAKIVPSLGEITGSIGANTFQRNRAGQIVRSKPHVTGSSKSKQMIYHVYQQKWLQRWQSLTQDQRDSWNTYANTWSKTDKFGSDKTLTGLNWFQSVNSQYYLYTLSYLNDPPPHDLPTDVPAFGIVMTSETISISGLNSYDFETYILSLWCAIPTLKNTMSINSIRKKMTYVISSVEGDLDVTIAWENATGLSWDPNDRFPNTNIFICAQSICRSSGISGPFLCAKVNTGDI